MKKTIGFLGVGLMGHGMAKNVVDKGWPLIVKAHTRHEAVNDLVTRGAREVQGIGEMVAYCDCIVLCVNSSIEVEAIMAEIFTHVSQTGKGGLCVIDTSTSEPRSTYALAHKASVMGITYFDAPLSRTPTQAWEGELTTFVGGPETLWGPWKDLLDSWSAVVIHAGNDVGTAHAIKLVNNLISIGYAALWAECYNMLDALKIDAKILREVVTNSGMNCLNFQNFSRYPCDGDPNGHKFALKNAAKDIRYYAEMASTFDVAVPISSAVGSVMKTAISRDMGERMLPELGGALK
ncbi:MAG: NAD(P)-dependent oxidoreductase [Pseudomonadota bacterium]